MHHTTVLYGRSTYTWMQQISLVQMKVHSTKTSPKWGYVFGTPNNPALLQSKKLFAGPRSKADLLAKRALKEKNVGENGAAPMESVLPMRGLDSTKSPVGHKTQTIEGGVVQMRDLVM